MNEDHVRIQELMAGYVLDGLSGEDAVEADYIFTTLMGDQVDPRKTFIEKHAKEVVNLDI